MYTEDDAAYDAYVAEHGPLAEQIDYEHEMTHRPVLTVTMARHNEAVEIRVYDEPRLITFTYPPVVVQGSPIDAYGVIREVPLGPRQDAPTALLNYLSSFVAQGWTRTEEAA